MRPALIVFSSGTAIGGGSGFENLVRAAYKGVLRADIVAVVSNHAHGGVRQRSEKLGVRFFHFSKPHHADGYAEIVRAAGAEFTALSGWLHLVRGLDPRTTFNIHPGPLPGFGGSGMYGMRVHRAVMDAFRRGKITHSAVSMHFVTDAYDRGPVFFRHAVNIETDDTPALISARVQVAEHQWQPIITDRVVHRRIAWDGENPASLRLPAGYQVVG